MLFLTIIQLMFYNSFLTDVLSFYFGKLHYLTFLILFHPHETLMKLKLSGKQNWTANYINDWPCRWNDLENTLISIRHILFAMQSIRYKFILSFIPLTLCWVNTFCTNHFRTHHNVTVWHLFYCVLQIKKHKLVNFPLTKLLIVKCLVELDNRRSFDRSAQAPGWLA